MTQWCTCGHTEDEHEDTFCAPCEVCDCIAFDLGDDPDEEDDEDDEEEDDTEENDKGEDV